MFFDFNDAIRLMSTSGLGFTSWRAGAPPYMRIAFLDGLHPVSFFRGKVSFLATHYSGMLLIRALHQSNPPLPPGAIEQPFASLAKIPVKHLIAFFVCCSTWPRAYDDSLRRDR